MNPRPFLRIVLVAALATVGASCATAPAPAPVARSMIAPPPGTQFVYHRVSRGSLGEHDGDVSWTFGRYPAGDVQNVSFISPQVGGSLHDADTMAIIAMVDATAKPTMSFNPPMGPRWPMKVGDTWTTSHVVTVLADGRKVPVTIEWNVAAFEPVRVPAGRFDAYKVVSRSSLGEVETRWISPVASVPTVKRHVERSAAYPQGAGVLDAELVSRTPPPTR